MNRILLTQEQSDSLHLAYLNDKSINNDVWMTEWFKARFGYPLKSVGTTHEVHFPTEAEMVEFKLRYLTA